MCEGIKFHKVQSSSPLKIKSVKKFRDTEESVSVLED